MNTYSTPLTVNNTPPILSMQTVVQNLNTAATRFDFLGTHGVLIPAGGQYAQPGNLVQTLAEEANSGDTRRYNSFRRCVNGYTDQLNIYHPPQLSVVSLPAPVLYDTTLGTSFRLTLANGVLGVLPLDYGVVNLTGEFYPVEPLTTFSPVTGATLVFNQPVTGFTIANVAMTRGGTNVPLTGATVTTTDNITWTLTIPQTLTQVAGAYVLTVAASAGIVGSNNTKLTTAFSADWTRSALTGSFTAIPGGAAVSTATLTFNEPVTGFTAAKLSLTLAGTAVTPLTGVTVASSDNMVWTISGLTTLTTPNGAYVLKVVAAGSGITDSAGNVLSANVSVNWTH